MLNSRVGGKDKGHGERLRPQRIQTALLVSFTHEEGVTGEGMVCNLSLGGCGIRSATSVSDGMLMSLQISLPDTATTIAIEMARVQWVSSEEFGIQFLMMLPKQRKALERFFRTAVQSLAA